MHNQVKISIINHEIKFYFGAFMKSNRANVFKQYFDKINCELINAHSLSEEGALDYLQNIFSKHIQSYPFHNFELRDASFTHPLYRQKLKFFTMQSFVTGYNGGFCFQNSQTLFEALSHVGFNVHLSIAKILNGISPDSEDAKKIPDTHLVMVVNLNHKPYLLDPSLASIGHCAPFSLLDHGNIYVQHKQLFKIEKKANEYHLYRQLNGSWFIVFCSSLLPATQKTIRTQLTKLNLFPGPLGIRDLIILVSMGTKTGGASLLWNSKTSSFTFKKVCSKNGTQEEVFYDIDKAYELVLHFFKIQHISRLQFEQYTNPISNESHWPRLRKTTDIQFPLDTQEQIRVKSNFK